MAEEYRDRLKGLYVVARSLILLLLTCSAFPCKFDHDFLVDVVSKISVRFEKISRDETFWDMISVFYMYRAQGKMYANLAKQDPGRARQSR